MCLAFVSAHALDTVCLAFVCMRLHTSAHVRIRLHAAFILGQMQAIDMRPLYTQDLSIRHIQKSRMAPQGYASSDRCSWWAGLRHCSIECQMYYWILKSYQHGTRIGGERDSRSKHITASTWNVAEEFRVDLRLGLHTCVCVRASAHSLRACVYA